MMVAAIRSLSLTALLLAISLAQAQHDPVPGVRRDLRPSIDSSKATESLTIEADAEAYEITDKFVSGLAAGLAAAAPQALAAAAAANSGLGPVLCNTLDCPSYKVLERYESTELRRYDPATFSSTVLSLDDVGSIEKAAIIGFHRLLKYNLGDNEDSKKVAMTAPVLYALDIDRKASTRKDLSFQDRFSVSFFVPFKYQDEPPSPSNPNVFLVDVKEVDIFVRSFDGYATGAHIHRIASSFLRDLYDDGHRVDCRTVYIAQYSPPFQPVFRYNEVWFLRRRRSAAEADPNVPDAEIDDLSTDASCDFLAAAADEPDQQQQLQQWRSKKAEEEVFAEVAKVVSEARRNGVFVNPVAMES